jgi:hypothetical protein
MNRPDEHDHVVQHHQRDQLLGSGQAGEADADPRRVSRQGPAAAASQHHAPGPIIRRPPPPGAALHNLSAGSPSEQQQQHTVMLLGVLQRVAVGQQRRALGPDKQQQQHAPLRGGLHVV